MRGSPETANRRYYDFRLTFEPNQTGQMSHTMRESTRIVRGYGWKDAIGQAEREFGFDRVRIVDHPANDGVATVYMDTMLGEDIVGQVTAKKVTS
jgi:hypothetical protein